MNKSKETNKKPVFRTPYDNKGWVEIKVKYPARIADSSQNVPMRELLAKFARGEKAVGFVPRYDLPAEARGEDLRKAVDDIPLYRRSGFDPADGSEAIRRGREAFKSIGRKSEKPDGSKSPSAAKTTDTKGVSPEAQ